MIILSMRSLSAAASMLLASALVLQAQERPALAAREVWLVHGSELYRLSGAGAAPVGRLTVAENAERMAVSADGSLLAVASDGPRDVKSVVNYMEWWPKANGHSSITIVRRASLEVAGRFQVPFRPVWLGFSPDSQTLMVVCAGQWSRNDNKTIPANVVSLDVSTGKVLQQASLAFWNGLVWHDPPSGRVIVAGGGPFTAKKTEKFELLMFDAKAGVTQRVALPAEPVGWMDAEQPTLRYLRLRGGFAVVSLDKGIVGEPVMVGESSAMYAASEDRSRHVLIGRNKKAGTAALVVSGRISKTVDLAEATGAFFDKSMKRAFVIGDEQTLILDTQSWAELGRIPTKGFVHARLDSDEKRLYWLGYDGKITAFDLESQSQTAQYGTGRGGMKFLGMLAPGLTQVSDGGWMDFGGDGRFLFAFNGLSSDISVVDLKQGVVVSKVATGPVRDGALWTTPDGARLVSCGGERLLVFDKQSGVMADRQEYKDARAGCLSDENVLISLGKQGTELHSVVPYQPIAALSAARYFVEIDGTPRFALIDKTAVRLYDMAGRLVGQVDGVFDPETIFRRHFYALDPPAVPIERPSPMQGRSQ